MKINVRRATLPKISMQVWPPQHKAHPAIRSLLIPFPPAEQQPRSQALIACLARAAREMAPDWRVIGEQDR